MTLVVVVFLSPSLSPFLFLLYLSFSLVAYSLGVLCTSATITIITIITTSQLLLLFWYSLRVLSILIFQIANLEAHIVLVGRGINGSTTESYFGYSPPTIGSSTGNIQSISQTDLFIFLEEKPAIIMADEETSRSTKNLSTISRFFYVAG